MICISKRVSSTVNRNYPVYIYIFIYRYQKEESSSNASTTLPTCNYQFTSVNVFEELFNLHNRKEPTDLSNRIANVGIVLLCEFTQINVEIKYYTHGKCNIYIHGYMRQVSHKITRSAKFNQFQVSLYVSSHFWLVTWVLTCLQEMSWYLWY